MASDAPFFEYRFRKGSSHTKIPFELNTNKPYVQVRANGAGPYWFMLDTGSVSMAVDTELAASLGLWGEGSFEGSGGGEGSITISTGDRVELGFEGLDISTGPVDILPINKAISFAEGRRVDGLIGYDFFAHFVVVIDYANEYLTVYDPRAFSPGETASGARLPLTIVRKHPFISAEVTARDGKRIAGTFLVDTCWRSALSLNAPFVAKHNLLDTTETVEAVTGVGVGGPSIEPIGRTGVLQLGSIAVRDPVTNFSRAKAGILSQSDMSGIVGGDVLRRFTATFDYPGKQLVLEPNEHFTEPYEFDMCGLMAVAEGDDLKTLRIYHVTSHSPASEAGLREGDVIASIDGQPAGRMSLEYVRRLFRRDAGSEHTISVLRDGRRRDVSVKLRRLITM
jgi:hypothetical protein